MPKNYLIGVGGTGARVIEAMTYLCAAGYGPKELNVFIVDPDEGNGNLTRTTSLLARYKTCRDSLSGRGGARLFKTVINTPEPAVWNVVRNKNQQLGDFINVEGIEQPELKDLISVLFTDKELTTELNEGFRGHPSIGSVLMADLDPVKTTNPWKMLWDDIGSVGKAHDLRVFLVGSVFGGTGAAGVPTFGAPKTLKNAPECKIGDASKILLGAALVLPYFTMDEDDDGQKMIKSKEMCVTHRDFPIATKAALQYYGGKDLAFDQYYFIGDSLPEKVGKFRHGKKEQENRPHYIELVSALAAYDFFEQEEVKTLPEKLYLIAGRETKSLSWDTLPLARRKEDIQDRSEALKQRVLIMTAFGYMLNTYGKRILDTMKHRDVPDSWYNTLFKYRENNPKDTDLDLRQGKNAMRIKAATEFSNLFLNWVAALDDESGVVQLISRERLFGKEQPTPGLVSDKILDEVVNKAAIGELLKQASKSGKLDFVHAIDMLNEAAKQPMERKSNGDDFVDLFYRGATGFCEKNYSFKTRE